MAERSIHRLQRSDARIIELRCATGTWRTIRTSSRLRRPMIANAMLRRSSPQAPNERQPHFLQRTLGYSARLRAKRRAERAALAEKQALIKAMLPPPMPLMLPAPIESPEI